MVRLRNGALVVVIPLLTQCAQERITIYETGSDHAQRITDQWVAEDDTIMLRYSFWAEQGTVSFVIYNKSSRQIFIDWKNSALVVNDRKVDYWNDAVRVSTSSSTSSRRSTTTRGKNTSSFDWSWITSSASTEIGIGVTEGLMVRDERITSLPPKSYIGVERFRILSERLDPSSYQSEVLSVPNPADPIRIDKVDHASFAMDISPLRLRNYLSISFHEDMSDSFSVDDSFWLSEISDMSYTHTLPRKVPRQG